MILLIPLSIMQLMMKLKSLEKSSITISSIMSMMVKCIRNCLMNLTVPLALTVGMSTSLNTARIKMEIKDIYANIVIRLSRPWQELCFHIQRRKPINGICIWNHSFVVIPLYSLLILQTYANIHLLCGDIRYWVYVLLSQLKIAY